MYFHEQTFIFHPSISIHCVYFLANSAYLILPECMVSNCLHFIMSKLCVYIYIYELYKQTSANNSNSSDFAMKKKQNNEMGAFLSDTKRVSEINLECRPPSILMVILLMQLATRPDMRFANIYIRRMQYRCVNENND